MLIIIKRPFILWIFSKQRRQELIFVRDTRKIVLTDKFYQNSNTNYLKIFVKIFPKKSTNLFPIKKLKSLKDYLDKMDLNKAVKIV
jgi:hypothetical protein